MQEVKSYFGEAVSPTVVPRNVRLSEAPSFGQPISLYDPRSKGAIAYETIAKELVTDVERRYGKAKVGPVGAGEGSRGSHSRWWRKTVGFDQRHFRRARQRRECPHRRGDAAHVAAPKGLSSLATASTQGLEAKV